MPEPLLSADALVRWAEYCAQFRAEVYPIFAAAGLTFGEALLVFKMNEVRNELIEQNERLGDDDPDRDAPWRRPRDAGGG
jgi:hypothetical protein